MGPGSGRIRTTVRVKPWRQSVQADVCICSGNRAARRPALLSFNRALEEGQDLERSETELHDKDRRRWFEVCLCQRDQCVWSRAARKYLAAEKQQPRERWNRAWIYQSRPRRRDEPRAGIRPAAAPARI